MTKREALMGFGGAGVAAVLWLGLHSENAIAQTGSALPTSCSSGDLLVANGGGRFSCRPLSDVLRLSGCSAGDFVVTSGGGSLRCERASSTSWGARNLLPDCSSGSTLVSEGFGRWRCESARR